MGPDVKLLVINNMAAGFGDGAIYDFLRIALQDGDEGCVRCTDGTTDLTSFLDDAESFDAVVVAGGDGTVAAVSHMLAYTGIPILPFPAGTANLLANNLHLPYEPHALANAVREMVTADFDLGEITAGDRAYGFAIMAGAGYDATIMSSAQPNKKLLGPLAYFQAAVLNVTPQKSRIKLVVDGQTIESEGLGVLLVNFSRIQMEIPLTHDSDARDGLFDIAILKAENAFGLIPAFIAGIMDRDGSNPDRTDSIEIYRGKSVEVIADPPFEIQYDGETPQATTPFTARVLDGAARFIMSPEGVKEFGLSKDAS